MKVKPVFHWANLFAREQRKMQLDWLTTSPANHIRFLLARASGKPALLVTWGGRQI
jgi:elongation factor P--beta-lysine ligase